MAFPLYKNVKTIFFDFDGVIKDSVEVKSEAFEQLFEPFGMEVAKKVRMHHEMNGGMSRYDKLPIYLEWAEQIPTKSLIDEYSKRFSIDVKQNVIECNWVPGVRDYLQNKKNEYTFFLVTATPQGEIEEILTALGIYHFFREVIGAPTKKSDAIKMLLRKYSIVPNNSVMIGDSSSDYNAAKLNGVPFVLRRTNLNQILQKRLNCKMIYNFL
jgi:HAD superfamily hydrolase (TIGR01549 family)